MEENKKIIYASFMYENHDKIAKYLLNKYNWKPVYWIGFSNFKKQINKVFPKAIYHKSQDLRRGRFALDIEMLPKKPLDKNIIEYFSKYLINVFDMMIRRDSTGWNFSYEERLQYYYKMLKYWNSVIHHLKPDIFISWVVPHCPSEYILYLLCKFYNIPTLLVNANACLEKYYVINTSIEDESSIFEEEYNSNQVLKLSDETKEYFVRLKSDNGIVPGYMEFKSEYIKKQKSLLHKVFKIYKDTVFLIKNGLFKKSETHFKSNRKPLESRASEMNNLQYVLFSRKIRKSNARLFDVYHSFTSDIDFSRKYIYFAPNYQPEATTSPCAGIFVDYFLILNILSSSIPEDWVIYFKEHPATFLEDFWGSLARNKEYYQRILSYKNVVLLPSGIDTFNLIDHSQAVVTPNGTVGWEAVVRGKPAMVFGQAWYVGCKSIFKINTYNDCINAIKKITNGYKPDRKDIERYAAAVEHVGHKNLPIRNYNEQIKACPNIKDEMDKIGQAFYDTYVSNYNKV